MAGLSASLGNGAMSNSVCEIDNTKCLLVFGYNAADSHPIVAKHVVNAKNNGAKIIVCDPRVIETARISDLYLQLKNGSNIPLVNAMAYTIITEGLQDQEFIDKYCENWDAYWDVIKNYPPESVEEITGLKAEDIRAAARMYAQAETATICWGMGVTQWRQGVEVVRGLASLALITGNLGKPNVGVNPVRGQNNVQGSCDLGCLPNVYPGYQPVTDPAIRAKFAKRWGVDEEHMSLENGFMLTDLPHLVEDGVVHAFWCMGEDPAHTEPDLSTVRKMLKNLDFMISQDIFMTETASYADVIFPATSWGEHECVYSSCDRGFQRSGKALPNFYESLDDWEIISRVAQKMGYPMHWENTKEIWDELRELCPLFAGATYEKMEGLGFAQWPMLEGAETGTPYLYANNERKFETPSGKGVLFAADYLPPFEPVDEEYPLILSTVREVGHYSCRSMTGNCTALNNLAEEPGYLVINPEDAQRYGIRNEELLYIFSRRGKVLVRARVSERANKGCVYMTYQWWIGACNELTGHFVSAITKTPEYKYCAVQLEPIADQVWAENHLQELLVELKTRLSKKASAQDLPFGEDALDEQIRQQEVSRELIEPLQV